MLLLPADVVVPEPPPTLVVAFDAVPPPELFVAVGLVVAAVVAAVVASIVLASAVDSVVAEGVCAADREKTEHKAKKRKV